MIRSMRTIVGKTVKSVKQNACNHKVITFKDGTVLEMEAELVIGSVGLYGIETRVIRKPNKRKTLKRKAKP